MKTTNTNQDIAPIIEKIIAYLQMNEDFSASRNSIIKQLTRIKTYVEQLDSLSGLKQVKESFASIEQLYQSINDKIKDNVRSTEAKILAADYLEQLHEAINFLSERYNISDKKLSIPSRSITELQRTEGLSSSEYLLRLQNSAFGQVLSSIADHSAEHYIPPTVYICYAWPHEDYIKQETWIQSFLINLRKDLRNAGITTKLDIQDNPHGGNIYHFMEKLKSSDYVIVIGSESLLKKHDMGTTAVATEFINILDKRAADAVNGKYRVLPIVVDGDAKTALPPYFRMYTMICDWVGASYLASIKKLIGTLYEIGEADKQADSTYNKLWQAIDNPLLLEPLSDESIQEVLKAKQSSHAEKDQEKKKLLEDHLSKKDSRDTKLVTPVTLSAIGLAQHLTTQSTIYHHSTTAGASSSSTSTAASSSAAAASEATRGNFIQPQ
jgi:hypothetical protein